MTTKTLILPKCRDWQEVANEYTLRTGKHMSKQGAEQCHQIAIRKIRIALEKLGMTDIPTDEAPRGGVKGKR